MSSPNQTIRSLHKEGSTCNFLTCNTESSKGYSWCFITGKKQKALLIKSNAFFKLAFPSFMLLKQFLNNLPICLEGLLNCIWTYVSIKVNVFIQKNTYYIHNCVHNLWKTVCSEIDNPLWLVLLIKD